MRRKRFRALTTKPEVDITMEQAEEEILEEMLTSHEQRTESENGDHHIVGPPETLEGIRRKIQRASALSGNSMRRIVQKLKNETDPNKH